MPSAQPYSVRLVIAAFLSIQVDDPRDAGDQPRHAVFAQEPSERTLAMSAAVNVMSLIPADSTSGRMT